jgi:hypothetical protein
VQWLESALSCQARSTLGDGEPGSAGEREQLEREVLNMRQ